MKTSDTFSITRFLLLVKQHLIHNHRMLLLSIVGFCGGLFILLLIMQAMNEFDTWTKDAYYHTFLVIFIATGLLYAGTSFPGLRSRERSFGYLLNPASTFEKFLFEFFSRIAIFLVLVPLLYWAIFHAEGFFLQAIHAQFQFAPYSFTDLAVLMMLPSHLANWLLAMGLVMGLLIFTLPFTGATVFMRYPLPKTLFIVSITFFFHMFLVYICLEILEFDGPGNGTVLGMDGDGAIKFFTIYAGVANIVLLTASYFKLKEREA